MFIVLILLAMAIAVLLAIGAIMIGSLLIGGILYTLKRARILLPVFLIIIPTATLGSLVGGLFIGSFLARANDHLIFLGPVGGFIAGGVGGLLLGLSGAAWWWWRMWRPTVPKK